MKGTTSNGDRCCEDVWRGSVVRTSVCGWQTFPDLCMGKVSAIAQISLDSTRHVRLCRASRDERVERVEPIELVVSSQSSCAVRLARHSQNAWARHVERVELRQAKWNLGYK